MRVGALLGLALICLLFPAVGPNRFWMAGLLAALTVVPATLPHRFAPRDWMLAQTVFDVGVTVLLAGFVPAVWTACLVIVVCSPAAAAGMFERRFYLLLESVGLAGLGTVAHFSGATNWQVPLAVAAMMVPLVVSYADVFRELYTSAEEHLDNMARSTSLAFWEIDPSDGDFRFIGGETETVFGHPLEQMPAALPDLLVERDRRQLWELILESPDDSFDLECRCNRGDGSTSWLRLNAHRTTVNGERVLRGMAMDITELAEAHVAAHRRADTDHLTGLPNRAALHRQLDRRCRDGETFALVMLDFDRFKDINDTLGHDAGDDFLKTMATRLSAAAPAPAFAARLGGDEFGVVVRVGGLDDVVTLTDALTDRCEQPVNLGGVELTASASMGVALAPAHGTDAGELLRRADVAMYRSKRIGRGPEVFDFDLDKSRVNRIQISNDVEDALASGDLRLWFQPKLDLGTRRITGAEGLLRWNHPVHGLMSPAMFLDVVELSRHRRTLCREVIRQGAGFVAANRAAGHDLTAAVNITIRDLVDPELPAAVESALEEHQVTPDRLVLEITERDLMDDRTGFENAAARVHDLGVGLSIDDFGTGQSSLLRLHWLPVTELKIDRSFISGLGVDAESEIIVRSIVELGRALGLRVVAEGIETGRQLALLRALRCSHGQGYLFSPAIPPVDFPSLLEAGGAASHMADIENH